LEDCVRHLKDVEGCEIVGIEISDDAKPVHSHPFKGVLFVAKGGSWLFECKSFTGSFKVV
jgi:hypothetical protein